MHQNSVPPRQSGGNPRRNCNHTPETLIHFPIVVLKEYLTTKDQPLLPRVPKDCEVDTSVSPSAHSDSIEKNGQTRDEHEPPPYSRFGGSPIINN